MEKEIWKPVKGYEKYYLISNYGRVKQLKRIVKYSDNKKDRVIPEKIIKHFYTDSGYIVVGLANSVTKKRDLKDVHRLVAEAFISNPDNLLVVNHKDGIKTNNYYLNLEWTTYSENKKHAIKNGLHVDNVNGLIEENKKHSVKFSCYFKKELLHIANNSREMAEWLIKDNRVQNNNVTTVARAVRKFSLENKTYYGLTLIRENEWIPNNIEDERKLALIYNDKILSVFKDSKECAQYLLKNGVVKYATEKTVARKIRKCASKNIAYYGYYFKRISS